MKLEKVGKKIDKASKKVQRSAEKTIQEAGRAVTHGSRETAKVVAMAVDKTTGTINTGVKMTTKTVDVAVKAAGKAAKTTGEITASMLTGYPPKNAGRVNMSSKELKNGIGLVLSGGGGRGAYEIGVWRALEEYGVVENITAVSGTSVGALNAALFAQGDLRLAQGAWESIRSREVMTGQDLAALPKFAASVAKTLVKGKIFTLDKVIRRWIGKLLNNHGVMSKKGLSRLIDRYVDQDRVKSFEGPVYVAAYRITPPNSKVWYFNLKRCRNLQEIKKRLIASASIPGFFGTTYIHGKPYCDGGIPEVGDNTPIKPLYHDGYRNFIVVHLTHGGHINRRRFSDCNIVEVRPQKIVGDVLSFDNKTARKNIEFGYEDAAQILKPYFRKGMKLEEIYSSIQKISEDQRSLAEIYHNRKGTNKLKLVKVGKKIDRVSKKIQKRTKKTVRKAGKRS